MTKDQLTLIRTKLGTNATDLSLIYDADHAFHNTGSYHMVFDDTNELFYQVRTNNNPDTQFKAPMEIIAGQYSGVQYAQGEFNMASFLTVFDDLIKPLVSDATEQQAILDMANSINNVGIQSFKTMPYYTSADPELKPSKVGSIHRQNTRYTVTSKEELTAAIAEINAAADGAMSYITLASNIDMAGELITLNYSAIIRGNKCTLSNTKILTHADDTTVSGVIFNNTDMSGYNVEFSNATTTGSNPSLDVRGCVFKSNNAAVGGVKCVNDSATKLASLYIKDNTFTGITQNPCLSSGIWHYESLNNEYTGGTICESSDNSSVIPSKDSEFVIRNNVYTGATGDESLSLKFGNKAVCSIIDCKFVSDTADIIISGGSENTSENFIIKRCIYQNSDTTDRDANNIITASDAVAPIVVGGNDNSYYFVEGKSSSVQLKTSAGTEPITWNAAATNYTSNVACSQNGIVSGTVSTNGTDDTINISATATNKYGSDTANASIKIVDVVTGLDSGYTIPEGKVGELYAINTASIFVSKAGTYYGHCTPVYKSGTLPNGITVRGDEKHIAGTPTEAGTFNFVVTVTNEAGSADVSMTIVIAA